MKSLYVHIPFCDHICTYCDFCKVYYNEDWANQYLDALSFEINDKKLTGSYDTIYIGGGTPSALSLKQLRILFDILKPFSQNVQEYSIEVNPESMNDDKLKLFLQYGINRLSVGVQTFDDELLASIHRYHSSSQAITFIQKAKELGFNDMNIDLIYGLPAQKLEDIYQDIDIIDKLDVSHVSIYSLILEDHTLLKIQNYQPLQDEEDALWYHSINHYLEEKGYQHYEVSNYYKGKPSLHNLIYWHYQDYDGIGLSAHSLKQHCRYENTNSLTRYFEHQYLQEKTTLCPKDELFEKIMMGLRLVEGICIDEINHIYQIDFINKYESVIEKYKQIKMLEIDNGFFKTTKSGMDYLNTILVDFLEE